MIRRVIDQAGLVAASKLRRSIADGQARLSTDWLQRTGAKVLAQESGRHLELDEAAAVARAYANAGIGGLIAIVNDALVEDEEAYLVDATINDLTQVSDELTGINFLLTDESGTRCLLFTTDDFKLVAGPLDFVTLIVGDAVKAKEAFLSFAAGQLDDFQPVLKQAASYMAWV